MTDDTGINDLEIKIMEGPRYFSLRRLAQKENEYPAFGEYFEEARKLAAGARRHLNRHSKKAYFWHEDSEYVVAELSKLYCWAAFSSRTIDKNKISVWIPHYGSTADDFKKAIAIAKGGILLVEKTENFLLDLDEFLGSTSLDKRKQAAIKKGWETISAGLGMKPGGRIILPANTIVIVIIKAKMTRPLRAYMNTGEILEQKKLQYPLKQKCTVWQTLSRSVRPDRIVGVEIDAYADAVLIGDTIYALDAKDKTIPFLAYADDRLSPFDVLVVPHGLIVMSLYRGIAQFSNQGKWGFMDVYTGKIRVPAEFDYVSDLCARNHDWSNPEAYAFAKKNGLAGIINQDGKPIIPLIWDDLHWKDDDCAAPEAPIFVRRKKLWGAVDMEGNILAPVKWRRIRDVSAYLDGRKPCSQRERRRRNRQHKEHEERLLKSMFPEIFDIENSKNSY